MTDEYKTAYYHYKQQTMIRLITGRTKVEGEADWEALEKSGAVDRAVRAALANS